MLINKLLNKFNLEVSSKKINIPSDILADSTFLKIYDKCRPFTMTSVERIYALYQSVEYTIVCCQRKWTV
jgi:hypothetical protein